MTCVSQIRGLVRSNDRHKVINPLFTTFCTQRQRPGDWASSNNIAR